MGGVGIGDAGGEPVHSGLGDFIGHLIAAGEQIAHPKLVELHAVERLEELGDAIAAVDLNADGARDIVTANSGSSDLTIALGDGRGGFVVPEVGPAAGEDIIQERHHLLRRQLLGRLAQCRLLACELFELAPELALPIRRMLAADQGKRVLICDALPSSNSIQRGDLPRVKGGTELGRNCVSQ